MDYMDDESPPRLCLQKCSALEFLESLPELLLRVHYDRAVPGHGLLDRLSRNQEEADPLVTGVDRDLVAAVEERERAVVGLTRRRRISPFDPFCRHREWPRGVAELPISRENIREGVARRLDREGLPLARRNRHVEVNRIRRDPVHRASHPPKASADDTNLGSVVVRDNGDVG